MPCSVWQNVTVHYSSRYHRVSVSPTLPTLGSPSLANLSFSLLIVTLESTAVNLDQCLSMMWSNGHHVQSERSSSNFGCFHRIWVSSTLSIEKSYYFVLLAQIQFYDPIYYVALQISSLWFIALLQYLFCLIVTVNMTQIDQKVCSTFISYNCTRDMWKSTLH